MVITSGSLCIPLVLPFMKGDHLGSLEGKGLSRTGLDGQEMNSSVRVSEYSLLLITNATNHLANAETMLIQRHAVQHCACLGDTSVPPPCIGMDIGAP